MSDQKSKEEIVNKLDKVADSLETTTSQLSGVVTQQQLDLIRERLVKAESDSAKAKEIAEEFLEKIKAVQSSQDVEVLSLTESVKSLDRDITAMRALTFSSFALGTVSIVGLILCAIYL